MISLTFDLRTCVVNRKSPTAAVVRDCQYIGRGSIWGNPFTHIPSGTKAQFVVATREESIVRYEEYLLKSPNLLISLWELNGKTLECYCKPKPCHGDILVLYLKGLIMMCNELGLDFKQVDWTDELNVVTLREYKEA